MAKFFALYRASICAGADGECDARAGASRHGGLAGVGGNGGGCAVTGEHSMPALETHTSDRFQRAERTNCPLVCRSAAASTGFLTSATYQLSRPVSFW